MKRTIAIILSMSMLFSLSAYAADSTTQTESSITDISQYDNNEVFIMYKDGSFEVVSYESTEALTIGLGELSENEEVILYQPNYSYNTTSILTDDTLLNKQWALYNDGSFYMEEQKNEFPVFEKPFEDAQMPGQTQQQNPYQSPINNGRTPNQSYGANNLNIWFEKGGFR